MSKKKADKCVDLKDFRRFEEKLKRLGSQEALDGFYEYSIKQMAARFLERVIPDTPAQQNEEIVYETKNGTTTLPIKGGALKRAWVGKSGPGPEPGVEEQKAYANSLPVKKEGKSYCVTVSNNTKYAMYVEYGHRQHVGQYVPVLGKPDAKGVRHGALLKEPRVEGQYMMTNAVNALESMAPGLAEKFVKDYIRKKL